MSDRMAVMNEGEIHQVGTPREVYRRPSDTFVADFIGNANLLSGSIVSTHADGFTVDLEAGQEVVVADSTTDAESLTAGDAVTLLFRPERFHIHPNGADVAAANEVTGTVEESTFLGSRMDYFVRVGEDRLHVVQQNLEDGQTFQAGEEVVLGFTSHSPFLIPEGRRL